MVSAPDPTDSAIERGAKAIHAWIGEGASSKWPEWDEVREDVREVYRKGTRLILSAAYPQRDEQ